MTNGLLKRFTTTALFLCAAFCVSAQSEGHVDANIEDSHDHESHSDHAGHDHADHDAHADHADHVDHDAHADHADHDEFVAGDFIIHHISDANEIHFFGDISAPLPMIFYVEGVGFDIFMSSAFHSESGGHDSHAVREAVGNTGTIFIMDPEKGISTKGGEEFWDISITKSVFGMFAILLLLIFMLTSMARSYSKNPGQAPTGMTNFLEPLVMFVRDDIANPIIGKGKSDRFMPFLLTTFFFIVASNLLGLIPFIGGFNITGTIGVTIVLASLVFIITTINSNKNYWGHLLWPPGVPNAVKLIVVPIEIFGIFLKPIVLMIRLTANISAGHIIILSFVSLIFIFNQDFGAGGGIGIGVLSTLFMIFMNFLELLVAFLQAYVFTLLAAIYFADATQEAHH